MSFSSLRNKITSTHTRGGQGRNIKKSKARQSLYNFCTTIAHVPRCMGTWALAVLLPVVFMWIGDSAFLGKEWLLTQCRWHLTVSATKLMFFVQKATRKLRFLIFLLKISDKIWLFQTNTLSLQCVFHSIRFKVNNFGSQRRAFFYALYDTHNPSSPDLSQITIPVATTPTIIRLISWNEPKNPLPLHQF